MAFAVMRSVLKPLSILSFQSRSSRSIFPFPDSFNSLCKICLGLKLKRAVRFVQAVTFWLMEDLLIVSLGTAMGV